MGHNGAAYNPAQYKLKACLGCGGLKFANEVHGNLAQDRLSPKDFLFVDPVSYLVCVHCRKVFDPNEAPPVQDIAKPPLYQDAGPARTAGAEPPVSFRDPPLDPEKCSHKWGSEVQPDGSRICIRCGDPK